jgi:hypothetical protein
MVCVAPQFEDELSHTGAASVAISTSSTPEQQYRSAVLYAILASILEGKAMASLRFVLTRSSIEAWSLLVKSSEPTSQDWHLALLMSVTQAAMLAGPGSGDFWVGLLQWEDLVAGWCKMRSRDEPSSGGHQDTSHVQF